MSKRPKCRCQDPTAVAILARISDKDRQTQASLEAQVRETREILAEPNGWHVVAEYMVKHRGSDLAGDANYMAMIRDARAGKFARLCVHKFDRLARRAYDREVYWHILTDECGIDVQAALERYDLTSRSGKLTKKTSEFVADIFLDNLREEVMKGMIQKLTAGGWVGKAPFGYLHKREEIAHNKSRRWVEVDPTNGPTVTLAFRTFAIGDHNLESLAALLNEHGYLAARGLPWNRGRVHRMLTNAFYVGRMMWNGVAAEGSHERLTDEETFERCRSILREHDDDRERRNRQVYALNRLIRFAELGCGSHAEYQAHVGISYYRSVKPGADGSRVFVPCAVVDGQVPEILDELEINPEIAPAVRRLYRREIGEQTAPRRLESERLKRRVAELEGESRGYVRLAAQGKISEAEFDQERARVASAIAGARHELGKLEGDGHGVLSDLDVALAFSAHLGALWERGDQSTRKSLAHLVFSRISIDNAGAVQGYELAAPFSYLAGLKQKACRAPRGGRQALSVRSNQVRFGTPNETGSEGLALLDGRGIIIAQLLTSLKHGEGPERN